MSTNELLFKCDAETLVATDFYHNKMYISDSVVKSTKISNTREVKIPPSFTLDYVCNKLGVDKRYIYTRKGACIRAKAITAVLLSKQHNMPSQDIADVLRLKTHSSILNQFINMGLEQRKFNPKLKNDWDVIKKSLLIKWEFVYDQNRKRLKV